MTMPEWRRLQLAKAKPYGDWWRERHHCSDGVVLGQSWGVDKSDDTVPHSAPDLSVINHLKENTVKMLRSLAAGVLLTLAFAGAALAATSLHQTPPIDATQFTQDCEGVTVADGKVLWHFVLTQTEADESMLTATFGYPVFDKAVLSSKNSGGVLHFNVTTDQGVVLLGAVATADGNLLNLSHVCIGGPTSTPSSPPSPTPSVEPSVEPSASPSDEPTPSPSTSPSETPSPSSTPSPTEPTPSATPSTSTTPPVVTMTAPPTDTESPRETTGHGSNPSWLTVLFFTVAAFLTGGAVYNRRQRR